MFAKLYTYNDKNILVQFTHDDDFNPTITITHELDDYMLYTVHCSFEDTDEGIDKTIFMLNNITEQEVKETIDPLKIQSILEKYK